MTNKTPSTKQRRRGYRRATSVRIVLMIWCVVSVAILLAVLFAPHHPPPPPPSEITYTDRPNRNNASVTETYDITPSDSVHVPNTDNTGDLTSKRKGYRITGTITDGATGQLLSNVSIRASYVMSDEETERLDALRLETKTNPDAVDKALDFERSFANIESSCASRNDGTYKMQVPRPGKYRMKAAISGYLSVDDVEVYLDDDTPDVTYDFVMSRGASISGRVLVSTKGIGAVGVRVYGLPNQNVLTDENGEYTISGLKPAGYTVSLDLSRTQYCVTGDAPSESVTIEYPDEHIRDVDFEVDPAGVVWGFVFGPKREPVGAAQVLLVSSESMVSQVINMGMRQKEPISGKSDSEGYYELFGIPLDKEWRLDAYHDDWAPQLTDPFVLTSGFDSVRIDIFVNPGSDVYGRVIDTDRNPVPDIDLACIPSYSKFFSPLDSPRAVQNTKSEDDGSFIIDNLPEGEYQIIAVSDKYKVSVIGEPIYPDGHTDIRGVEVVLEPLNAGEFTVFGHVYADGNRNRPIDGVKLSLTSMSATNLSSGVLETTSDATGYFEIDGVDQGFVILNAKKNGYSDVVLDNVLLGEENTISMDSIATVRGTVLVKETGKAPDHYNVRAIPKTGQETDRKRDFFQTVSHMGSRGFDNKNGEFTLELGPGSYTLEARAKNLTSGTADINLVAGRPLDGVRIYLSQAGGTIAGQVRTKDGRRPAGALVNVSRSGVAGTMTFVSTLEQMDMTGRKGIKVGRDGRFEFRHLTDGTYTVSANMAGYARAQSDPIEIRRGGHVSGVTIELGFGGSVEGYVVMDGELKSGAPVTLVGNGVSKMTSTDNNGRYRIDDIPEGSYLGSAISFDSGGLGGVFSPLHARIEVFEGRTTTHNFGEETGTSIVGMCSPVPKFGTLGYAIVRLPGSTSGMSGMNFANPMDWFSADSTSANQIVSMSQVGPDGFFKIENVPSGTFQLEVYYMSFGEVLGSGGQAGYSHPIRISGEEIIDVHEIKVTVR